MEPPFCGQEWLGKASEPWPALACAGLLPNDKWVRSSSIHMKRQASLFLYSSSKYFLKNIVQLGFQKESQSLLPETYMLLSR